MRKLIKLLKSKDGATAIEYGLIAALISVGIIAATSALGTELSNTFTTLSSEMAGAGS